MQAPKFSPKKVGITFMSLAVAMFAVELAWKPIFTLPITEDFGFPIWVLSLIYGALQYYIWQGTQQRLPLTNAELKVWGSRLERATPAILEMYQASETVGAIAQKVEETYGLPQEITLRYIIALGQHLETGSDAPVA
jgi:hypothetical protein